ncbi:attachment protein [Vibrio cincinnatiensis]|uniref:Ail/Lom family outer membrane beta-barrel protein n=1 Tax=Vibrio cincinnatiensis TaxID=675 RepID=UPI001EDF17CA|nr:Ail/Lom family outer membrane beta-barrel protein [Vibrio cincinnatiensis]MCG3743120.1 attachment protein [Vibrio cincinnatiensis]
MKKIALIAAVASVFSTSVLANEIEKKPVQVFSVGYANSSVEEYGYSLPDDAKGFNLKYSKTFENNFGLVGSFTYTNLDKTYYDANLELTYWSLMAGPSVKLGDRVNLYGLLGFSYGKVDAKNSWLTYSDNDNSIAAGVGAQFYITDNFAIDASYEYTEFSGDVEVGTWSVGAGYRF